MQTGDVGILDRDKIIKAILRLLDEIDNDSPTTSKYGICGRYICGKSYIEIAGIREHFRMKSEETIYNTHMSVYKSCMKLLRDDRGLILDPFSVVFEKHEKQDCVEFLTDVIIITHTNLSF